MRPRTNSLFDKSTVRAQLLNGRALDLRCSNLGHLYVVHFSKTLYHHSSVMVKTPDTVPTGLKNVNWDVKHQLKQTNLSELQIKVCNGKLFFLFLNQNISCGYSKKPSQGKKFHAENLYLEQYA